MPGKHETSSIGSSLLKTTTWGALIACSAVMFAVGLLGHNHWGHSDNRHGASAQVAEESGPAAPQSEISVPTGTSLSGPADKTVFAHAKPFVLPPVLAARAATSASVAV